MSLLANLTTDSSIEDEKDVVGGGYSPFESGLYTGTVALAFLTKSTGGALALNLHLSINGRELRQQLWMTSGDAKGNKNFYLDKDGEKQYLPGFIHANALALLTVGKEISQLDTEKKVVNLYSSATKSEVPTEVEMLVDLLGKEIMVGVIKQLVAKNAKDASGEYVPTGESREENEIDKFFRASDRKTTAEIRAQVAEAAFADTWAKKWTGQVRDRMPKGTANAGASKPAASASAGKPTTSLFG